VPRHGEHAHRARLRKHRQAPAALQQAEWRPHRDPLHEIALTGRGGKPQHVVTGGTPGSTQPVARRRDLAEQPRGTRSTTRASSAPGQRSNATEVAVAAGVPRTRRAGKCWPHDHAESRTSPGHALQQGSSYRLEIDRSRLVRSTETQSGSVRQSARLRSAQQHATARRIAHRDDVERDRPGRAGRGDQRGGHDRRRRPRDRVHTW